MPPLIEMRQIVKHFPGIVANDQVTFAVRRGEIHGLLGENGAGKTTLMNILYGLYHPDSGEILLDGAAVRIDSPKHALELGIGMVHQHFRLIPRLTVLENIMLGSTRSFPAQTQPTGIFSRSLRKLAETFDLDSKSAETKVLALAEQYGLKIHPHAKIWELSVGEQQRVEIIKALYREAKLLILDEPTAVLTPQEVDHLFAMLRSMVANGYTIIFISHKLNEVLDVCQQITVLRGGRVVSTVAANDSDKRTLARMMVGRDVLFQLQKNEVAAGNPVLNIEHLTVCNDKGLQAVQDVSLTVHEGEIVGIAGVSGNGQRELIEALNGLRPIQTGRVFFDQREITHAAPQEIIACGVGYIPEDRVSVGLATSLPIPENLLLKSQRSSQFSRGWLLHTRKMQTYAATLVRDFDVRTPTLKIPVGQLSGGNIQKLILAREIARDPKLLIASQPTRGLDVGAIEYVQKVLLEQRQRGKAILLVSENLDEILHLSDRIAVMYEGQIVSIVSPKTTDRREIGLMMTGGHKN